MRPHRRVTILAAASLAVVVVPLPARPAASPAVALAPAVDHIVVLREGSDLAAMVAKEARLGNAVSEVYREAVDGFVAELDSADVARLKKDRDVALVEPDRAIRLDDDATSSTSSTSTPSTSSTSTTSTTVPDTSTTSTTSSTTPSTTTSTTAAPADERVRWIVRLRPGTDAESVAAAEGRAGADVVEVLTHAFDGFIADLTSDDVARLEKRDDVADLERDEEVGLDGDQTSPPWGLDRVDQRTAALDGRYSYDYTGAGVTAYVVDTGVRPDHREFTGRMADGFGAIADGRGTTDCHGHGTHVAGTVAGSTYGVAKGATIVPVRVLNCRGSGTTSGVISGVNWMIGHHQVDVPAVANMSLGGLRSASLNLAVANAVRDGIVMAVAAGNNNRDACGYSPASEPLALTVGASSSADARASFSNFGSCVDLFAPGVNVVSASHGSSSAIRSLSGTSMASPHVAGAIALLLHEEPALSPAAVATRLLSRATPDVVVGAGAGSPNLLLYTLVPRAAPLPVAPSVPRDLVAVGGAGRAELTWSAPSQDGGNGITDYVVEWSADAGVVWRTFADGVSTATRATVTGLTDGVEHRFRVRAVSAGGTSEPSEVATTTPGIPGAPTGLTATAGNARAALAWRAPTDTGGSAIRDYVVQWSVNGGETWTTFDDGTSAATAATVTGLTNDVAHVFRVRAVNATGTGPASSMAAATPWPVVTASAPLDLRVTGVAATTVSLAWALPRSDGNSTITDYRIETSVDGGTTWSVVDDGVASMRSRDVGGLARGSWVRFRVSAITLAGVGAASGCHPRRAA